MSNFLELVKTRRSVRTFDGNKPDAAVIDELKAFAKEITNPYDIPVRFVFLDKDENDLSSPVLTGENTYVSAVINKGEHSDEAYGYAFQAFLMRAHELGLGTVWIGGTMARENFEKASNMSGNEIMPCMSPLGKPAKKMSVKETLMRKGTKADKRLEIEELFFAGDFNTPLTRGGAMEAGLLNAIESVRFAPSAVNKQPWRVVIDGKTAHFYERHDKGFQSPDYDMQRIDIGIALYNFEQELLEEGRKPVFEVQDPGLSVSADTEYIATIKW